MCQKSLKNDLGIKIDNIQLLKHIFMCFLHEKCKFSRKKNLKFFGFSQNVALHRGGRGSAEISKLHKKLQLHRGGGVFDPRVKNLTQVSRGFEKISLLDIF